MPQELTHVDASGAARMVDVAAKDVTARRAVAAGFVRTTSAVIDLLRDGAPRGHVLGGHVDHAGGTGGVHMGQLFWHSVSLVQRTHNPIHRAR